MSDRIGVKGLSKLLNITPDNLRKKIRRGEIEKKGLKCEKNYQGYYEWDYSEAFLFSENYESKSSPIRQGDRATRLVDSIVDRILNDNWPYDTDNVVFENLGEGNKQRIMLALAFKGFSKP